MPLISIQTDKTTYRSGNLYHIYAYSRNKQASQVDALETMRCYASFVLFSVMLFIHHFELISNGIAIDFYSDRR